MSRPITYIALAVALGCYPAVGWAQAESPTGKAPAAGEEIRPKPGPATKAPAPGALQPVKPTAAERPAGAADAPKPAAEQQPAAKPGAAGQAQPAPQPTADQPAAQQPGKPTRSAKRVDPQQQTRIREAVKGAGVHPEANVSFHVSVGVRVPRTVRFYPLPPRIVEIVPEYEGYEFFLVGDEIIIVDPETLEIVDVIPA